MSYESEERTFLVAVRIRPESEKERSNPISRVVVQSLDHNVLVFDPPPQSISSFTTSPRSRASTINGPNNYKKCKDVKYAFHRVFDRDSSQEEVYEGTAKTLIKDVLEGFNATVFAYGATGAGKTHTMIGSHDDPGVMVRTTRDLFEAVEAQREKGIQCELVLSYLEIYNETIRDLLAYDASERMPPALEVREDTSLGTVTVSGLSQHRPMTADDVFELLAKGNANRRQSPTGANAVSSRSHAVLQITLHQRDKGCGTTVAIKTGKLSLIDLAGSERAAVTNNRGTRLIEGANINRSLLALANCINALCTLSQSGSNKTVHIPYRDSKLTRLLKDSLGGNCRTVMIASVSPSSLSYEDTHNTLKYAHRASAIKPIARTRQSELPTASNGLRANVVTVNAHVAEYKQIIEELKSEVNRLRQQLQQQQQNHANQQQTSNVHLERIRNDLIANFDKRFQTKESLKNLYTSSIPAFGTNFEATSLNSTLNTLQRIAMTNIDDVLASSTLQRKSLIDDLEALNQQYKKIQSELAAISNATPEQKHHIVNEVKLHGFGLERLDLQMANQRLSTLLQLLFSLCIANASGVPNHVPPGAIVSLTEAILSTMSLDGSSMASWNLLLSEARAKSQSKLQPQSPMASPLTSVSAEPSPSMRVRQLQLQFQMPKTPTAVSSPSRTGSPSRIATSSRTLAPSILRKTSSTNTINTSESTTTTTTTPTSEKKRLFTKAFAAPTIASKNKLQKNSALATTTTSKLDSINNNYFESEEENFHPTSTTPTAYTSTGKPVVGILKKPTPVSSTLTAPTASSRLKAVTSTSSFSFRGNSRRN